MLIRKSVFSSLTSSGWLQVQNFVPLADLVWETFRAPGTFSFPEEIKRGRSSLIRNKLRPHTFF